MYLRRNLRPELEAFCGYNSNNKNLNNDIDDENKMVKLTQKLISSLKSAGHSGKGIKYYRKENYEKALHHYMLVAQYQDTGFTGSNPALLEYLSMTHAQLGNLKEALTIAEQTLILYQELGSEDQFIADAIERLEYFIELLREEDYVGIKSYLSSDIGDSDIKGYD